MLITKRGTWWEVLHSWWLLLTFAPFALTAFLAFFYIGYRAKNKKMAEIRTYLFYYFSNCFCAAARRACISCCLYGSSPSSTG